jgi:hypothetical protein
MFRQLVATQDFWRTRIARHKASLGYRRSSPDSPEAVLVRWFWAPGKLAQVGKVHVQTMGGVVMLLVLRY